MSVTVPISQQWAHPPLDILTAKHHIADISGTGVINAVDLWPGYAVQWGILTVGVELGFTSGYINTYEERLAQLVLEWDIGSSGAKQYQIEELWWDRGFFWYREDMPARMYYYCNPAVSIELNRVSII